MTAEYLRCVGDLGAIEAVIERFAPATTLMVNVPLVRTISGALSHINHSGTPVEADRTVLLGGPAQ